MSGDAYNSGKRLGNNRMISRRYLVSGRVQGVGFRHFVFRAGSELRLAGWVRNLADGRVEAHAQGALPQVEEFEGRLYLGPPHAEVRRVETIEAGLDDKIDGFHIR